uniref:Uncharacterized protein n=1 Tax=Tanacetum cinerariifolium TaxID=118510 RepID=A0A6L2JYI8_TANCI|nr:hypothetical protein [Tanacetum cinerariifolium]
MFDEDVVDHIAKVLELLDLIKIPGVDSHRLRMKGFPLSLADDASQWWINEREGKITTWEELVEKLFCKLYPKSYDDEDEMLDERDNWGIDPLESISRVNSSFENHMKVDGRTKKKSDHENPLNTATNSFFKAHDEHDIEEGNKMRQKKRKEDNKNDEQPNKRVCKAEKFEAIKQVNTARPKAVINAVRMNRVNDVKASACWVWKPIKPNSASITLKRYDYVDVRGRSRSVMAWVPNKKVDYGLWEVIENGATFPKTQVVDGVITMMPIMNADEKQQRRLEVKIRSTLMKVIPNKHQLKFNSIKYAKQLLEAVERRFDRNTTTKKTQRNLLKQQFEKFFASSSEMLDQTFDRLQNTNGVVNTAQAINTANGVATARIQVNVIDNLSDAVICAFPASQPNSPQLAHENVEQIHPDDIEEIDLRCATTDTRGDTLLGSVELQEIKIPSTRRSVLVETPTSTALVSCDGLGGYDWSDQKKDLTMHS